MAESPVKYIPTELTENNRVISPAKYVSTVLTEEGKAVSSPVNYIPTKLTETQTSDVTPACDSCEDVCMSQCMWCEAPCQKAGECDACEDVCQNACETACQDTCEKTCQSCESVCQGCQGGCQSSQCKYCENSCLIASCMSSCMGCQLCVNYCQECLNCEEDCEYVCTTCLSCQDDCEFACQDCMGLCQVGCEYCEGYCQNINCMVCLTCMNTCETEEESGGDVQTNIAERGKTETSITVRAWYQRDLAARYCQFYCNGDWFATVESSGSTNWTTQDVIKTGLSPNTTYEFYAVFKDGAYNIVGVTQTIEITTLQGARPDNWSWSYDISSGGSVYDTSVSGSTIIAYIMPASEWNNFTGRINDFRAYKGLSNYSFTSVSSGSSCTPSIVNQAVNAINDMGFSISAVSSGNVPASVFNQMMDKLNSIL